MAYTNPAFQMLGIKQIKLPSRNWMIFWTIAGTVTGGIVYDKWKQRKLREEFMLNYQNMNKNYPTNQTFRKLRIYISPPPNDYLEESLKYFRRFVKPIINASGLDYEVITMERQGDIRYKVAEEIRELRRSKINSNEGKNNDETNLIGDNNNSNNVNLSNKSSEINHINPVFKSFKSDASNANEENELVNRRDLYKPMDVLGAKKLFGDLQELADKVVSEDSLVDDVRNSGGIICIGRGAYKEFINGVHEGLLGPLNEPPKPEILPTIGDDLNNENEIKSDNQEIEKIDEKKDEKKDEDEDKYAPAAYIYFKDYSNADIAPELELNKVDYDSESEIIKAVQNLRDENGKPYFFVQPILELRNYNVAGFTRQPERIWRFYHKRDQLIEYNEMLINLIKKKWCFFNDDKLDAGIEEENDWPNSWIKFAKEHNSEWVRDFGGDKRVLKLLSSYNCNNADNNENSNDQSINDK